MKTRKTKRRWTFRLLSPLVSDSPGAPSAPRAASPQTRPAVADAHVQQQRGQQRREDGRQDDPRQVGAQGRGDVEVADGGVGGVGDWGIRYLGDRRRGDAWLRKGGKRHLTVYCMDDWLTRKQ